MGRHRHDRNSPRYNAEGATRRLLALADLPPGGAWHLIDGREALVALARPRHAVHAGAGQPFSLLMAGNQIVGLSAPTAEGAALVDWAHLARWADRQHWWIDPQPAPSSN